MELDLTVVITPDFFHKLDDHIRATFSKIDYNLSCADRITRTVNTWDEVGAYGNPSDKEVRSLIVYANTLKGSSILLNITNEPIWGRSMRLRIDGDEQFVSSTRAFLVKLLASVTPWYAFLSPKSWWLWVAMCVTCVISGILAAQPALSYSHALGAAVIAGALLLGLFTLVRRGFVYVFPYMTFACGLGEQRYRRRERWRKCVVGLLLVLIVATAIACIVFARACI